MKNIVFIILTFLLMGACSPIPTPDIQATIENGISQTQAAAILFEHTSTPEPTRTPTPEYCPKDMTTSALIEIGNYLTEITDIFKEANADYKIRREKIVNLTLLGNDLKKLNVPGCVEYLKELMLSMIQDLSDANTAEASGSQVGYTEKLTSFGIHMDLFNVEANRIFDCLPNCTP